METTATTPSTVNPQDDRVSQHLRNMADEADALLRTTARAGGEKFDATREQLRDDVRRLRTRVADLEATAAARLKSAARRTDEVVHDHPYGAIGVVAVAGLLLGFLMARR
jgi:ElaB/YqjD/DUF883 family membrane-anchored ribosome-binding protein